MKTIGGTLGCGLLCAALAVSAADDPRAVVLIVGDKHLESIDYAPGIPEELQLAHPEWRVVAKIVNECTITGIRDGLDGLLADVPHADAVILLTGSYEVYDGNYAPCDASACGARMAEVLKTLKEKPATAKAVQVVITPVPVVEARLEQALKDRITGGEERSKAVAEAYRAAAQQAGAKAVDLYTFVLGTKEPSGADTRPGWLLGSRGWTFREWGVTPVARFVCKELAALDAPAADAAAYETLKKQIEADRKLDAILSQSSAGTVACGTAFAPAEGSKAASMRWTVPADALTGAALDVLVTTDGGTGFVGIMAGSKARNAKVPELTVTVEGGATPSVTIKTGTYEWQEIDEAAPETPVRPDSWLYNASYQDYFHPIVGGKAGERRQALIRFPLGALKGLKVTSAVLAIAGAPIAKAATGLSMPSTKDAGQLQVFPVTGPDRNWHCSLATWKTRDGQTGWTGGSVDAGRRKALLEEFLKSNPPAGAAARAADFLKAL